MILELVQVGLPAYVANGSPPFLIKLKKHPIDGGKKWKGKRILGDGKTWEGLFFAIITSTITGIIMKSYLSLPLNINWWGYSLIGFGVMLGDAAGSFVKRRKGLKRGENAGIMDTIDFIIGALLAARIITPYSWTTLVVLLILTPIVHRIANIIGYRIGVKKEPW